MTLAGSRDPAVRAKAATILSCASTKDQFCDLFCELVQILERISPVLIPSNHEVPAPRAISVLSESLLVWKSPREIKNSEKTSDLFHKLDFLCKFTKSNILYRGVTNFPIEDFLQIFNSAAALADVFVLISEIFDVLVTYHAQELLLLGTFRKKAIAYASTNWQPVAHILSNVN